MSLLVLHQLEDKLTCHQLFLAFLKNVGLWPRLNAVSGKTGNTAVSTVLALAEHNEKIVAAITLRTIHNDFAKMVDTCIKACLDDRDITAGGNLTAQVKSETCPYRDRQILKQTFKSCLDDRHKLLLGAISPQRLTGRMDGLGNL